jgi:hypothetical protein
MTRLLGGVNIDGWGFTVSSTGWAELESDCILLCGDMTITGTHVINDGAFGTVQSAHFGPMDGNSYVTSYGRTLEAGTTYGHCYRARVEATASSGASNSFGSSMWCAPEQPPDPPDPDPVFDNGQDCENPGGYGCSPIVIDLGHDGYQLTGATEGVRFDIDADGVQENISWTAPGSNDAFLWLDENGNGNVDNGSELFGDAEYPNGFEKLRRYDSWSLGGNGDGMIDPSDSVWNNLMLWIDSNHDGISQAGETMPLNETDFFQIALRYQVIGKNDAYGNQFRYKSKAYYRDLDGNVKSDHVFDIVFVSAQ